MAKRNGALETHAASSATLPKLLTVKQLRDNLTISRTAIYRAVKAGSFPQPIQLTPTRIAFDQTAVLAWVASRQTSGRGAAA